MPQNLEDSLPAATGAHLHDFDGDGDGGLDVFICAYMGGPNELWFNDQ